MTTKTEQAELEELGMSEEQLAERRRTLEATLAATPTAQPDAPAGRKTRSDAGKPRPVKPVAVVQPTNDAAKKFASLADKVAKAAERVKAARDAYDNALADFDLFADQQIGN